MASMICLLIVATGCTKSKPQGLPPAPGPASGSEGYGPSSESSGSVIPGSQADFVAKAGSDTVHFQTDRYELDPSERGILDAQASWLLKYPSVRITIEGHCDERGTREYNLALGEKRANSVKNYLANRGVTTTRMSVISYGKERPVAMGSDEQAWAQNRRAVTVLISGAAE
jgi:peptidoglycan-associated lipoprotein